MEAAPRRRLVAAARKSKTGCITCRIRRVKCDEETPSCQRCTKSGLTCDGYSPVPLARAKLVEMVHAVSQAGHRGPAAEFVLQFLESDSRSSLDLCTRKKINESTYSASEKGWREDGTPPFEGYSDTTPRLITMQNPNSLRPHMSFSSLEGRHFDFFHKCTVPLTGGFLSSEFWTRLVLQLAVDVPAVKHIVLTLSALHQDFEQKYLPRDGKPIHDSQDNSSLATPQWNGISLPKTSKNSETLDRRQDLERFSTYHYNKAIIAARQLLGKGTDIVAILVVCLCFVCCENLMGRYDVGHVHRQNGQRILQQQQERQWIQSSSSSSLSSSPSKNTTYSDPDTIAAISEVFSRIDFQAMTFSESRAPYSYTSTSIATQDPLPLSPASVQFQNLSQAWGLMIDHIRWFFKLYDSLGKGSISMDTYTELLAAADVAFREWAVVIDVLKDRELVVRHEVAFKLMQVYYTTMLIIVDAGPYGPEMIWDKFHPRFERIVELCDSIIHDPTISQISSSHADDRPQRPFFTFELGVILPLLITAHRCRSPLLRRRAISLLTSTHRMEGNLDSIAVAAVATKIMEIEEEHLGTSRATPLSELEKFVAGDIPEDLRVKVMLVIVDTNSCVVNLTCMRQKGGLDGEWSSREEVVPWA